MMLCSRCKKRPAVVFITAMQGEKKKNDGLCLVCAKELHVPQIDEYMKQMGITDEELEQISNQMMDMMDGESFEMGGSGVMPQFLQSFMKDPGKIFGNLKMTVRNPMNCRPQTVMRRFRQQTTQRSQAVPDGNAVPNGKRNCGSWAITART